MKWALIKNSVVENVIIADEAFIATIRSNYDEIRQEDDDVRVMPGSVLNEINPRIYDDPPVEEKPKSREETIGALREALETLPEDQTEIRAILENSIRSLEEIKPASMVVSAVSGVI